jgi:hypothetical protein
MRRQAPGVVSTFKADYGFMLGLVAPIVGWALLLAAWLAPGLMAAVGVKPGHSAIFLGMAVLFTGLGLPVAWLRWRRLQKLFAHGRECQGEILSVWLSGDRGRVEFCYQVDGKEYQSGMALHRSASAEALAEGQTVDLLVDPENPATAILPQLFQ